MTEQSIQGGINDRDTPEQRLQWIKGQLADNRKSLAALGRSVGLSPSDAEKVAQGMLVCDPLAIKICRVVKRSKTELWPNIYVFNETDTPEERQQWIINQLMVKRRTLVELARSVGLSETEAEQVALGKSVCDALAVKICQVVKRSKTQLWPWLYENDGSVRPGYSRPS